MGGEEARGHFARFVPLVLLLMVSGVAAAAPTDHWSTSLGGKVVDVDLTPSGRAVAATADGIVTFTDDSGKTLRQEGWATPAIRVSRDGLTVAVARAANAGLIDNSGKTLWEKSLGGKVTAIGMDRDARLVAAGADDKYVYLFDSAGTQLARAFIGEVPSGVAVAGDRVAVGLPSGKVLLLDRAGNSQWQVDAGAPVNAVDLSSSSVVAATASNSVVAFSLAGEKAWSADIGSPAAAVALSDDGSLVLAAAQAGDARLFNSKGEFQWSLKAEGDPYTAVGFSPGGYFAALGTRAAVLKVIQIGAAEALPEGTAAATPTPATATPVSTAPPTAATPSPTPAASPAATVTPSPSATPAPKKSPGFEVFAAIAALGAAVSLRKLRT